VTGPAGGRGGRATGVPSLFNPILINATDDPRMRIHVSHGRNILVSAGAIGRLPGLVFRSIGYDVFEQAVLCRLAELKLSDVIGKASPDEDKVTILSGQLETVNRHLDALEAKALASPDVTVFYGMLEKLDRQKRELARELEAAKAESASQQGDVLGEFTSLCQPLAAAGEDEREGLRTKVRAALRRVVTEMRVVIVNRGRTRLVCVTVYFQTGKTRSYMFIYRRENPGGGGRLYVVSDIECQKVGVCHDLRTPDGAVQMVAYLEVYPADRIEGFLAKGEVVE
jgi:hypothetical protein